MESNARRTKEQLAASAKIRGQISIFLNFIDVVPLHGMESI